LFDDVDISAFHTCVVVDLWQSVSEWHLLGHVCIGIVNGLVTCTTNLQDSY